MKYKFMVLRHILKNDMPYTILNLGYISYHVVDKEKLNNLPSNIFCRIYKFSLNRKCCILLAFSVISK